MGTKVPFSTAMAISSSPRTFGEPRAIATAVEKGTFVPTEAAFPGPDQLHLPARITRPRSTCTRWLRDQSTEQLPASTSTEGRALARLNLWPDETRGDLFDRAGAGTAGAGLPGYVTRRALYVLGRDEVRWRQFAVPSPPLTSWMILPTRGDSADDYKAYGRLYAAWPWTRSGGGGKGRVLVQPGPSTRGPPAEVRDEARSYLRAAYQG